MKMGVRLLYRQQVAHVLTVWLVGKIVRERELLTNASSDNPPDLTQPTLDPQSAHLRLTEDVNNSPSSKPPPDPKDAAVDWDGRHIVSRGPLGGEGVPIHSPSLSRESSLAQ